MTPHVAALCYAARVVIERAEWYSPALRRMEQALDAVEREPDAEHEALVDLSLAGSVYLGERGGWTLAASRMRDALTVAVKLVGGDGAAGPEAHTDAPSGAIPPTAAPSAPDYEICPKCQAILLNLRCEYCEAGWPRNPSAVEPDAFVHNGTLVGRVVCTIPHRCAPAATLPAHEPATSPGADVSDAGEPLSFWICDHLLCGGSAFDCPYHNAPESQADGHAERVVPCDPVALRKQADRC